MGVVDEDRRSVARTLGAALTVAAIGGLAVGAGLAAFIGVDNALGVLDSLLLAVHLSALYGTVFGIGLLAAAVALIAIGRRPNKRLFTALLLAFCVFLNGVLRFSPAVQLLSVVPSMNLLGLIDLMLVATAAALVAAAVIAAAGMRRVASAASALAVLAGLQFIHAWHETPIRTDIAAVVPPLVKNAPETPRVVSADRFENAKLVVLGFDGLSWEVLIPLLERGELPNFARLLQDAAYGYNETLPRTVSPVIWETISTGQQPRRHGIGHHFHFEFAGLSETVNRLPVYWLNNSPMGIRRLLSATKRIAPWRTVPASSMHARVARVWEIASRAHVSVGVYSWLNTTPAVPVRGFLRGHGAYLPMIFPGNIGMDFSEIPPPEPDDPTGRAPTLDSISDRRRLTWIDFLDLAQTFQPELLMYYTHDGDAVNHLNWKYEVVGAEMFYAGFRRPKFRPGVAITVINAYLDEMLGDAMARLPDDATIAIVSDHGFDFRGYEHDNYPPGVFIIRGPGIEPGNFEGASVYDVTPTVLHVLGLPVADDMDGTPVTPALLGRSVERVTTYGPAATPLSEAEIDPSKLDELESYLRGLGYVVD